MRTVTIKLSDDARAVLARSTITPDSVKLPEQLDRKLYVEIDKVFKMAGGKWNRGRGLHLFDRDPREVLGLAVASGAVLDEKKTLQFFETPSALGETLVKLVRPTVGCLGLEPSAGRGTLAKILQHYDVAVDVIEIHPPFCAELRTQGYRSVVEADFLTRTPLNTPAYDVIVMNPPFHNGEDVEHIMHAYSFLARNGRLSAITSPAWEFREGRKWEKFRELIRRHCAHEQDLPAGTFSASGTEIRTKLILLER